MLGLTKLRRPALSFGALGIITGALSGAGVRLLINAPGDTGLWAIFFLPGLIFGEELAGTFACCRRALITARSSTAPRPGRIDPARRA
jgi:hypothetical protein